MVIFYFAVVELVSIVKGNARLEHVNERKALVLHSLVENIRKFLKLP